MNSFEWFLLIVVVVGVPLIIAVVVTLWTIDQANKRKRANRKDAQIGVKRKAALSPEEVEARKAARAEKQAAAEAESAGTTQSDSGQAPDTSSQRVISSTGNEVTINNVGGDSSGDHAGTQSESNLDLPPASSEPDPSLDRGDSNSSGDSPNSRPV